MTLRELVLATRSVRRFKQDEAVGLKVLEELVDLARNTASGGNMQPLKYVLSTDPAVNERIFSCLAWAAYLKDWRGPEPGERPAAYMVVLLDKNVSKTPHCDHGIAAQTIMLGATEKGLAGCILGAVDRKSLARELSLDEQYEILLVLALGKAAETVSLEDLDSTGDIKYWRDDKGGHHVPKRSLEEVVLARYAPGQGND